MHELYICWICLEPPKMAQCIGQSSHYRRKEHHKLQKQFVAECKLIQNMKFSRTTLYCTLLFVINIYRYKRVVMNLHSGVRMILHTKLLLASVYIIGRCFLYVGAKFSPVGKRHKCVCVCVCCYTNQYIYPSMGNWETILRQQTVCRMMEETFCFDDARCHSLMELPQHIFNFASV